MSLRGRAIEEGAELPGGAAVTVRVGVPEDSYISPSESNTVSLELRSGEEMLAAVNTILDPEQESEARALALEVVRGLESGEVAPSAAALEPFANRLPDT